jgi:signal peptidase II
VESDAADVPAGAGTTGSAPRRRRAGWGRIAAAVGLIVAVDQVTKAWAVAALSDGPINVIGTHVQFDLTRNGGSAFGRFQGMTPLLAVGAIAVSVFLVRAVRQASDGWMVAALTLVLGGAVGNLTDRVVRAPGFLTGHVVDFVKVGWWPVFNLADSCITVGAVLLVVRSLLVAPPESAPAHSARRSPNA